MKKLINKLAMVSVIVTMVLISLERLVYYHDMQKSK